jgi:hypothetical protein
MDSIQKEENNEDKKMRLIYYIQKTLSVSLLKAVGILNAHMRLFNISEASESTLDDLFGDAKGELGRGESVLELAREAADIMMMPDGYYL